LSQESLSAAEVRHARGRLVQKMGFRFNADNLIVTKLTPSSGRVVYVVLALSAVECWLLGKLLRSTTSLRKRNCMWVVRQETIARL
jgi:hypothetical protein